jgi:hypothetical protein
MLAGCLGIELCAVYVRCLVVCVAGALLGVGVGLVFALAGVSTIDIVGLCDS